jgi:hypothetical protein
VVLIIIIKWWLEENDYIVNASEFNDFDKPLDTNSYEACLKAIDNSDYFILFIGDRIGGMYDDEITITQKEYRHAYNRMLLGKLKIINFIRQDLWTNFLENKKKIKTLKNDPSIDKSVLDKLFSQEEKIRFAFIDEVRRLEEMKNGDRPKNNWLHPFNTFSDMVAVFKNELGNRFELSFKQNRFIILKDIQQNLRTICSKDEDKLFPIGFMFDKLWKDFQFDPDNPKIILTEERYLNYASFYVSCLQLKPFRSNRIESFYKSGFFLEYDKNINDFTSGDLNQMASILLNTYDRLNGLHKSMYDGTNNKLLQLGKKSDNSHLNVTSLEIFFALEFYDDLQNCISLSKNLYKALKELKYSVPRLIRHERVSKKMRQEQKDIVTEVDVLNYLNS